MRRSKTSRLLETEVASQDPNMYVALIPVCPDARFLRAAPQSANTVRSN